MTPQLLTELAGTGSVHGRHVVVTAHADDEVITFGAALRRLADATILQLTTGVPNPDGPDYDEQVRRRSDERAAAQVAGGWAWPTVDGHMPARRAHLELRRLLALLAPLIVGADVAWTHPYESGHLDHDSAAWLVQTACEQITTPPLRMEFASYHARAFGEFWPPASASVICQVTGEAWRLKLQALQAYASQAHIIRKFPSVQVEHYRIAPFYDFTKPAPTPASRWDMKGYQPSTAVWRASVAAVTRDLREAA